MSSQLKKKVKAIHVGKNLKETSSALMSDLKVIGKDTKKLLGNAATQVRKNTKAFLNKVEKKLG